MKPNTKIVFWNSKAPIFLGVFLGQLLGIAVAHWANIPLIAGSVILGLIGGIAGYLISKRKNP